MYNFLEEKARETEKDREWDNQLHNKEMHETDSEEERKQAQLSGEGYPQRILQTKEVWPYRSMIHAQSSISAGKWDKTLSGILR